MKLYYVPRTRAGRARWMLEELGVPYEVARLDPSKKENRTPEYLAIHPLGHVPSLVDGDLNIIESAAIVLHLADKYPEKKLAPPPGSKERAQYYQWIMFAMVTIEPPIVEMAMHSRFLPEEKRSPAAFEAAKGRLKDMLGMLDTKMGTHKFAVGDHFTAADVVFGGVLIWGSMMGVLEGHPHLQAYAKALSERPAYVKSNAD